MGDLQVLAVEDDLPSLELLSEVLTSLKAHVTAVSDSREAAILVNCRRFDGIFLDLEMPAIRGLELTERIRNSSWNKSTPVTVVTGRHDREAMRQAFQCGATFYLQKPIDRQKLAGLFRTVRGTFFDNRRRYARVPLDTEVNCIMGQREVHVKSRNLSRGGMQVETDSLPAGECVRLQFQLPGSHALIETSGLVVWTGGTRRGIHFTTISECHSRAIREFIARTEEA